MVVKGEPFQCKGVQGRERRLKMVERWEKATLTSQIHELWWTMYIHWGKTLDMFRSCLKPKPPNLIVGSFARVWLGNGSLDPPATWEIIPGKHPSEGSFLVSHFHQNFLKIFTPTEPSSSLIQIKFSSRWTQRQHHLLSDRGKVDLQELLRYFGSHGLSAYRATQLFWEMEKDMKTFER